MIWLIPGLLIGMAFGFWLAGLLRAASKPTPLEDDHLHDWYECDECRHLLLIDFWNRHEVTR